jgi:hypothetical protein
MYQSFIPQANNTFRLPLLDNKLQALVSMVTSLLLCSFLAYSKVHALVSMLTLAKDLCDVNMETQQC